jgi:phosphatidylserine/phosphatidylglycerophosphate/cardiolipin synthase-like enzyme
MKKILVPGRNCQGIFGVHKTGILVDGRNYFRAFYHAARRAQRYILMTGWQFERSVRLLRGSDEKEAGAGVRMTDFLNGLCERNQNLRVFILMWDFSALVSFDKEWFNKFILDVTTNERIHFRFDGRHALYASHHQKLVVIDGAIAFVGGLDFAANSWDDRRHWADNAERFLAGDQYDPYHDVQSFTTGPLAWELTKLFQKRWLHAGGGELSLEPPSDPRPDMHIRRLIPIQAQQAAISVTRAQTLLPVVEPVKHIRRLYIDAIDAAEKLIYMESQYFSSQAVYEALKTRLIDQNRPCPQIVLILPKRLHTLIEDISLSVIQAKMLRSLTEIAVRCRRMFGVYYTAAALRAGNPEKATYIHSKVLLVDDRFLSVGSANITNRSMGMDTELNLSWEAAGPGQEDLVRSIRRLRGNLLAEHTGLRKLSQRKALSAVDGLVEFLNRNADRVGCRLRRHTMESFLEDVSWIKDLMPEDLSIDPERPIIEESIYELISRDKNSVFAKGILLLNELISEPQTAEQRESRTSGLEVAETARAPGTNVFSNNRGRFRWCLFAALGVGIAALAWLLLR